MNNLKVVLASPNANDFGYICRICLEKKIILRSIFNPSDKIDENVNNNIHKKLKTVSNIQVQPHDKLPKNICIKCINFLFAAYFFKKLCEESDAKLRSILRESSHSKSLIDSEEDLDLKGDDTTNHFGKQNIMKIGDCSIVLGTNEIKEEPLYSSKTIKFDEVEIKSNRCNKTIRNSRKTIKKSCKTSASDNRKKFNTITIDSVKQREITKIGECTVRVSTNDDVKKEPGELFDNIENSGNKVLGQHSDGLVYFDDDSNDYCPSNASSDSLDWNIPLNELAAVKRIKILPLQPTNVNNKPQAHKEIRQKILPLEKNKPEKDTEFPNVKNLKHAIVVNKKILPLNKNQEVKRLHERVKSVKTKSIKKPLDTVHKRILPIKKALANTECLSYFECLICNVKYNEKVSLYKHMASEHKDKRGFKCYACNLTFKSITGRDDHKRKHCPNEKKSSDTKYECKTCKMVFPERSSYKAHMKKHKQEIDSYIFELKYTYRCDHCDYSTSNKNTLKNHLTNRHLTDNSQIKHFVCETCGKHYTKKSSFSSHISTHYPPEKKYKCSYCEYRTNYRNGIKHHERRNHTRECKYTCEECGKSFITSGELKTHKKRHSGVRDFQCNLCEKNYARKSELKGHVESVHDRIRPYKCIIEHCNSAFYQRNKCVKHLRQVHKITTNINIPSVKEKKELLGGC